MTRFVSLSSGSSGNSVFVDHKGVKILVDAGFSGKKMIELLGQIGRAHV